MKRTLWLALLLLIPLWTLTLNWYHWGAFPPPKVDFAQKAEANWYPRQEAGINNLVLIGPAFARGRAAGEATAPLLLELEVALMEKFRALIPLPALALRGLVLASIVWFHDVQDYLPPDVVEEMYGTSLSAPKSFDYIADGLTRQVAYHGLHEVGQAMVDHELNDGGCTAVAVRSGNTFVVGRNFDFEAGPVFDREKIIKWVFPDEGHAFVSVIWAGMVGAVTGVNEKGVYISLNAAGSSDHRRIGTPSTVVLLSVLKNAATSEEALEILRKMPMFISDIFVVLDKQGHLYRVEKSPARTVATALNRSLVIANHFNTPEFTNDTTNESRKKHLTTVAREKRGLELVEASPEPQDSRAATEKVLSVLRDKGVDSQGQPLPLGHRRAIDALIAMHSVIYNPVEGLLYVGQGPAVSGPFLAYDLKASFASRTPVRAGELPADPLVSQATYSAVKQAVQLIAEAHTLISQKHCSEALAQLEQIAPERRRLADYYSARGDVEQCLGQSARARNSWQQALTLEPAYTREIERLQKKLQP